MGDNLAQLLYTTFINAGTAVVGSEVPSWGNLPSLDREQWEQVAVKARREMSSRFVASIDSEVERCEINPAAPGFAIAAIRSRWVR